MNLNVVSDGAYVLTVKESRRNAFSFECWCFSFSLLAHPPERCGRPGEAKPLTRLRFTLALTSDMSHSTCRAGALRAHSPPHSAMPLA